MKTEDKLKKYVEANRAQFDQEFTHQEQSWKHIKKQLPKQSKGTSIWWKVAASFLLLTTITLLVERTIKNDELAYYEAYIIQQEERYLSKIQDRKQQLTNYKSLQTQLPSGFGDEINKLDSLYSILRKDLMEGLHTDQLVDAMIQNLQMRVEILDRQIQILEQLQELKEQKEHKYENVI